MIVVFRRHRPAVGAVFTTCRVAEKASQTSVAIQGGTWETQNTAAVGNLESSNPFFLVPVYRAAPGLRQDPGRVVESPEERRSDMPLLLTLCGYHRAVQPLAGFAVLMPVLFAAGGWR